MILFGFSPYCKYKIFGAARMQLTGRDVKVKKYSWQGSEEKNNVKSVIILLRPPDYTSK